MFFFNLCHLSLTMVRLVIMSVYETQPRPKRSPTEVPEFTRRVDARFAVADSQENIQKVKISAKYLKHHLQLHVRT